MKRAISWMSWGLILLAGMASCSVVVGMWGRSAPATARTLEEAKSPPLAAGMSMGVPQTIELDPGTLEEETRTPRQRDDQARDWLMWVVASSLMPDAGALSDMLFDAPIARKGHLQSVSRMEYGTTRAFVLPDGDVVALVPQADAAQREDDLAQVFDDQRRNLAATPERIHVYEYALTGPHTATVTRKPAVEGKAFLTPATGYRTALVTNVDQLRAFITGTDDLLAAEVTTQGLKVSGRRMNASYRNIGPTEVAALWQAEEAIKLARNGAFGRELSALEAKANREFQTFKEEMPLGDHLENMARISAEEQRLQRNMAAEHRALVARYVAAGKVVPVDGSGFSLDPIYDYEALATGLESDASLVDSLSQNAADKKRFDLALAALRRSPGDEEPLLELGDELDQRLFDPTAKAASARIGDKLQQFRLQRARYDGPLNGTEAGMILFYTDLLAKLWALDFQGSAPGAIADFIPYAATRVSHVYDAEIIRLNNTRLWFGPENSGFEAVGADRLLMGRTATRIYAASANTFSPGKEGEPNAESSAFLGWWNDHYDEVARYEPQYQRLNQLMKWSLLIAWLERNDRASQLGFLETVDVDRSAWFPDWVRQHPDLRFNRWHADPFKAKGYLGHRTEVMVLLASEPSHSARRLGADLVEGMEQVSGGVSLGSSDNFLARAGNTVTYPAHQRRAGINRVEDTSTVRLSGQRTPVYELPPRTVSSGNAMTANRATQKITPFEGAKVRGPHGDMKRVSFERLVDRIADRTVVRLRAAETDVGTLSIRPVSDGYRVSWGSRDADAAYVLGRRLSEHWNDWRQVLGDPAVAHAARDGNGEFYVNLQGSDRWILLSPQERTVPDIGPDWEGRVSAESPVAPTYALRWLKSGLPPGVRDRAHWVRGPPPPGALGLRLPSEGNTVAEEARQIADDAKAWRSRKQQELQNTLASLDAMAEHSPRAAVDRGLEAQAAMGQHPELLMREAFNELRQEHEAAALAAMNRVFAAGPRQKQALLDEVNGRLAKLQGAQRAGLQAFGDALKRQTDGTLPAGSELRMVDTGGDGLGIGVELRLSDDALAGATDVAPGATRNGALYVQDSLSLDAMDVAQAPQAAVDGVIFQGTAKVSSIPVGKLGDFRPHRIIYEQLGDARNSSSQRVSVSVDSPADRKKRGAQIVFRLAGTAGNDDCNRHAAACEEERIYLIRPVPAASKR